MRTAEVSSTVLEYLYHAYVPHRDVPEWMLEVCERPSDGFDYSVDGAIAHLDALFDRLT